MSENEYFIVVFYPIKFRFLVIIHVVVFAKADFMINNFETRASNDDYVHVIHLVLLDYKI